LSPPNSAANKLNENVAEVRQLLTFHQKLSGTGPGRRHEVEILNKSAVVLLVACWEAFVEDICENGLEFAMANSVDHTVFSSHVLERVASLHAGPKAWDLAGDGWKECLRNNLTEVLARTTGLLNTPKTSQVNTLFKKTLGIPELSKSWYWNGRSHTSASEALDDLVTLRGSIAHRLDVDDSVRKDQVKNGIELVFRLSVKTSNKIRTHVHEMVGKHPWASRKFKKTR